MFASCLYSRNMSQIRTFTNKTYFLYVGRLCELWWVWVGSVDNAFLWQPTIDVLVFSGPTLLSFTLSPNERKDTSITATMLLQDSMLNPSVLRSLSEIQEKTHWSITWIRIIVKHLQTFSRTIVFQMNNRKHRSEEPHAEIMWEIRFKYDTNKRVLRFPMILFRMFISSVGLTSMSYMTNIWECKHDKASEKIHRHTTTQWYNAGERVEARIALTSPASCLKTWRNCLSSSLSCCSAYTAGLRCGFKTGEESQH